LLLREGIAGAGVVIAHRLDLPGFAKMSARTASSVPALRPA
jgi:hypothetical protein